MVYLLEQLWPFFVSFQPALETHNTHFGGSGFGPLGKCTTPHNAGMIAASSSGSIICRYIVPSSRLLVVVSHHSGLKDQWNGTKIY